MGGARLADHRCSQPTYEELKPAYLVGYVSEFHRSQPTYEELKLSLALQIAGRVGGSQPTYEELKPQPGKHQTFGLDAPSLPMRN